MCPVNSIFWTRHHLCRDTLDKQKDSYIGVRVPRTLKNLVHMYLERAGSHLNEAEFVRDAIREKIRRDAPDLYSNLFKLSPTKGSVPT